MKITIAFFLLVSAVPVIFAAANQKTINGWVLDSACALTKGLDKPISRECALSCARNGSPLVILQDDGSIVWPVSESMPAKSQNDKLVPYAGKRVTITGKMYAKGGSQAIVMQEIRVEKK